MSKKILITGSTGFVGRQVLSNLLKNKIKVRAIIRKARENFFKDKYPKVELIITNEPLTTTFIGNVYAFDNEIKLWSDKILILYTETESQIDQIKSFGNTKLVRENQEIISDVHTQI